MLTSRIARLSLITFGLAAVLIGCADKPSLFPNSDPALRKDRTEFAADAVKRFPFPTTAPTGGELKGGAVVDVGMHTVQVTNLSDVDWTDIDVWLNQSYVVHVPKIEAHRGTRTLNYDMIFDDKGHSYPVGWQENPIKTANVVMDGKVYTLEVRLNE